MARATSPVAASTRIESTSSSRLRGFGAGGRREVKGGGVGARGFIGGPSPPARAPGWSCRAGCARSARRARARPRSPAPVPAGRIPRSAHRAGSAAASVRRKTRGPGGAPTPPRSRWPSPPAAAPKSRARRSLSCTLLRDAQHRRTRARIGGGFGIARELRATDRAQRRFRGLRQRQAARQAAPARDRLLATDEVLDDAVLQRMEADHGEATTRLQRLHGAFQPALQRAEFVIDVDAQAL